MRRLLMIVLSIASSLAVQHNGLTAFGQVKNDLSSKKKEIQSSGSLGEFNFHQRIRSSVVCFDGNFLVAHLWKKGGKEEISVIDLKTGRIIHTFKKNDSWSTNYKLTLVGDGSKVLINQPRGFKIFDIATGKLEKEFQAKKDHFFSNFVQSSDRSQLVGSTFNKVIYIWNTKTWNKETVDLSFLKKLEIPFAIPIKNTKKIFVFVSERKRDGNSRLLEVTKSNPKEFKELEKIKNRTTFIVSNDGKKLLILKQEDPNEFAWTRLDQWDLNEVKLVKETKFPKSVSTINYALSSDNRTLFLHEYIMQKVHLWDVEKDQWIGTLPKGEICMQSFAMTPNGKTIVGTGGAWKMGSLRANKLFVFDLDNSLEKAKPIKGPMP